jgi:hypothetical protein
MMKTYTDISNNISHFHRALWMVNPFALGSLLFAISLVLLFWASSLELRDAKFLKIISTTLECTTDTNANQPGGQTSGAFNFEVRDAKDSGNKYLLVCAPHEKKPIASFLVKKTGYLWALNWSLGVCLIFPIIIGVALWSAQNFFLAIETVHRRRMLVKRNRLERIKLSDYTNKFWRSAFVWCSIGFFIGSGLVMKDYAAVVLEPLRCAQEINQSAAAQERCKSVLFDPSNVEFEREYDWSISSTFPMLYKNYYLDNSGKPYFESPEGRAALKKVGAQYDSVANNLAFSTAVYLLNAFMSGVVTAYYALLAIAAAQVYKFTVWTKMKKGKRDLDQLSIMPDLSSQSVCKWFEHFSPSVQGVLLTCFFGVIAMYLMRVQNLFLREDYSFIGDLFLSDPGAHLKVVGASLMKIPQGKIDMPTAFDNLYEVVTMAMNDTQAWYAFAASVIVIYVSTVFFIIVLRSAAFNSRLQATEMLEKRQNDMKAYYKETFSIRSIDEIRSSLNDMKIWPMAWPNEKKTGLFLIMGIIFLTFYKLFPWFLVACCVLIVTWVWKSGVKWLE